MKYEIDLKEIFDVIGEDERDLIESIIQDLENANAFEEGEQ